MKKQAKVKITPATGRPMLNWVGKRALTHVPAFPAQHVETFNLERNGDVADIDWSDWPEQYPHGGLLFHGDNKEVLAHLLVSGFRGKVKLVYIDPPFDSGADYLRRVHLRGHGTATLDAGVYSLGEQIQYQDIWANDAYLQFMYERLLLLRELLADSGGIVLHCDWHRSHQLRCLLDEVFGATNIMNEIIWQRTDPHNDAVSRLGWIHDTLLWYRKGERGTYNWKSVTDPLSTAALREYNLVRMPDGAVLQYREELVSQGGRRFKLDDCTYKGADPGRQFVWRGARPSRKRVWPYDVNGMDAAVQRGDFYLRDPRKGAARCRVSYLDEREGQLLQTIWTECGRMKGGSDYPTQKPELLLNRIVRAFSDAGDLVLDCFIGSGSTAVAAQKLGRRWIGCDINKGAIQTTSKRLQAVVCAQVNGGAESQRELDIGEESAEAPTMPAQLSFTVSRVNDYDLQVQHNEAVELACEHIGIERMRTDSFFDGTLGKALVKIIPFGHPLSPVDLEDVKRELEARPEEDRDIVVICLGKELAADAWIEEWNQLRRVRGGAPNRIEVIELRSDPKYGKFIAHRPADARVDIRREKKKIVVEIRDFISPTILDRLDVDIPLFRAKIPDWRSAVDCVMIDTAFDGSVFNVVLSDVPERRDDLVRGRYELPAPKGKTNVAVKIIDMLGEEVIVTTRV